MNEVSMFSPQQFLNFLNDKEAFLKKDDKENNRNWIEDFHVNCNTLRPVPYPPKFLKELENYLGQENRAANYGISNLPVWIQKLRGVCREEYRSWKNPQDTDRISSYFAVVVHTNGFIGTLKTQYEAVISMNNILGTGSTHVQDCIKECLGLVKYYLMAQHRIPASWLSITQYISLDWKKSFLEEFQDLDRASGESFCFLFCALFYATIVRKLVGEGKISVRQKGRELTAQEIGIPTDILMTGTFDFSQVPDMSLEKALQYRSIPVKKIDALEIKEEAALSINEVEPDTFQRFVFAQEEVSSTREPIETKGIKRIPVDTLENFFQTIFPYEIVVKEEKIVLKEPRENQSFFLLRRPYRKVILLILGLCLLLGSAFVYFRPVDPSEMLVFYEWRNQKMGKAISPYSAVFSYMNYRLQLTIESEPQYVYIFQADGKQRQPLFPCPAAEIKDSPEFQENWYEFPNPTAPGKYWIPPEDKSALALDDTVGIEQFIVIHSSEPVSEEKQQKLKQQYHRPRRGYLVSSQKKDEQKIGVHVYGYEHK